jgi:uncharacterized protein
MGSETNNLKEKEIYGMNLESHLDALTQKHNSLEHFIEEERLRPNPDNLKLSELKRQKLRIKEEMVHLQH